MHDSSDDPCLSYQFGASASYVITARRLLITTMKLPAKTVGTLLERAGSPKTVGHRRSNLTTTPREVPVGLAWCVSTPIPRDQHQPSRYWQTWPGPRLWFSDNRLEPEVLPLQLEPTVG